MDQHISIDIHVAKLIEWLISRRHCQNDWHKEVLKIRAKINSAIQDMPENREIASLLSGSYLNYFHCLQIFEILRKTEADSKNIFGRYSSKRMKDWNEIIGMYTKNNIYLAESSDIIMNLVKYDIPNLKKQVSKQQQLQADFIKKEAEAIKCKASAVNELNSLMKELGLEGGKGEGYRRELLKSSTALAEAHSNIAKEVGALVPALAHYVSFASFTQPNATIDVSLISYIAEKGNTTTFEFLHGKKPEEPMIVSLLAEAMNSSDEAFSNEEIEATIDWGCPEDAQIEIVGSGDGTNEANSEEPQTKMVDTKERMELLSVLDNSHTRANFTNQLLELRAFLKGRLLEDGFETTLETQVEPLSNISGVLATLENILILLQNPTIQHHYNITHSRRYLDEMVKKLEAKEDAIERAEAVGIMCKERAEEAMLQATTINSQVAKLCKYTRQLQLQIAKEISQRYSGRRVNLVGGAPII